MIRFDIRVSNRRQTLRRCERRLSAQSLQGCARFAVVGINRYCALVGFDRFRVII
jgi:hypothetical protein